MNEPIRQTNETIANLRDAIRRARLEDAERTTAVADLRAAEIVRLEILRDALAPVLAEIPDEAGLFDNGLVPGEHPRLHVDILAFVEMAPDRRHYRFIQDTRWGHRVMAETDDIQAMIRAVTDYVALRLVEREKALASDSVGGRLRRPAETRRAEAAEPARPEPARPEPARAESPRLLEPAAPPPVPAPSFAAAPAAAPQRGANPALAAFAWFLLGVVVGILAILAVGLIRARGLL